MVPNFGLTKASRIYFTIGIIILNSYTFLWKLTNNYFGAVFTGEVVEVINILI